MVSSISWKWLHSDEIKILFLPITILLNSLCLSRICEPIVIQNFPTDTRVTHDRYVMHKMIFRMPFPIRPGAILRPGIEENISFHLNLVSQLDALVGEAGIPRNFDKRKQPYMAIYVYQLTWHAYVWSRISKKRLENFQQYFVSC